jgi:hypothetical protein
MEHPFASQIHSLTIAKSDKIKPGKIMNSKNKFALLGSAPVWAAYRGHVAGTFHQACMSIVSLSAVWKF